jgi:chromosome segregation ATPase
MTAETKGETRMNDHEAPQAAQEQPTTISTPDTSPPVGVSSSPVSPTASSQQHPTFFSRIGNWFKRGSGNYHSRSGSDLPLINNESGTALNGTIEQRSTFLRPWAKRDAAIANLQDSFHTLTDLMSAVRDNLDRQTHRQDELLQYLSHLPQALQTIPESNRVQTEVLRAIHTQLENQQSQQRQLNEILDRISKTGGDNHELLDALHERVERLHQHDQSISDNLRVVGDAMQSVTKNSTVGTEVLSNLRDNISSRDGQLERILNRQNTRFTTMLAIAIFLSIAAIAAVGAIGYLLLTQAK